MVGSALGLASVTYDLSVTSTLLGASGVPAWYAGVQHWADGLGTAFFALLAAMGCIAVAILRTRALPRWAAYVFMIATVLLLGQYAAFRGALPFPQFLAFIAVGIAELVHRARRRRRPGREPAGLAAHDWRGPWGPRPGQAAGQAQPRILAFSRSNSAAVMTPRSRRSASLASWSAELCEPAASWT